jgi:hypothetical protein
VPGLIIEEVSGMPYEKYQYLRSPAVMEQTGDKRPGINNELIAIR